MLQIITGMIRYLLAIVMIAYGWVKIIGVQFEIPDDVQNIALRDLDGVTVAFAFLGYSKWLAVVSGIVEISGAILLMFKRTYLFGALILLPVLMYVFLVNIGYGFSTFMRTWTGGLLLLDIILLVNNKVILENTFSLLMIDACGSGLEWIVNIFLLVAVIIGLSLLIPTLM